MTTLDIQTPDALADFYANRAAMMAMIRQMMNRYSLANCLVLITPMLLLPQSELVHYQWL